MPSKIATKITKEQSDNTCWELIKFDDDYLGPCSKEDCEGFTNATLQYKAWLLMPTDPELRERNSIYVHMNCDPYLELRRPPADSEENAPPSSTAQSAQLPEGSASPAPKSHTADVEKVSETEDGPTLYIRTSHSW